MSLKGALLLFFVLQTHGQSVDVSKRVDCYPEPGSSSETCQSRGCIWEEAPSGSPTGTPWCYYPTESGFTVQSTGTNSFVLAAKTKNPYGDNISPLNVKYSSNGATLLLTIGNDDRYVPPVGFPQKASTSTESLTFSSGTIGSSDIFSFKVTRTSTGAALWDTSIGGMQFADKFIQIATYLPTKNIYGFGDHIHKKIRVRILLLMYD
ncbi:unnamed protein product [Caenorhabditis sp. 36 PRJEB53466]|nr:unnamed protein product [Caenorhabditis sp. 36 PRJEB53466]